MIKEFLNRLFGILNRKFESSEYFWFKLIAVVDISGIGIA